MILFTSVFGWDFLGCCFDLMFVSIDSLLHMCDMNSLHLHANG